MKVTRVALSLQLDTSLVAALEQAAESHGASSIREYVQTILKNHVSQLDRAKELKF